MGIVRDVFELLEKKPGEVESGITKRLEDKDSEYSSMARRAAEGTLQFPLLISRAISYDTATKIAKATEVNAASFVSIVLTMNPEMNTADNKGAVEYIRRFHKNIDTEDDIYGQLVHFSNTNENMCITQTFITNNGGLKVAKEELKEYGIDYDTGTINDVNCYTEKSEKIYSPEEIRDIIRGKLERVYEAVAKSKGKKTSGGDGNQNARAEKRNNNTYFSDDDRRYGKHGIAQGYSVVERDILSNQEIKQANSLAPILMHVRVIARDQSKENSRGYYVDFMIGVKATMHPIESDEMISEITNACRYHDELFRFIRWTTGEINFFTDFLLNLKDSRASASREQGGGSPWWNRLQRMRSLANFKVLHFFSNRILPNTTVAVTQQEVDHIKTTFGFDLMNPLFAEQVMNHYFLLCFIVVDESMEVVHFKYDGQKSYTSTSFAGLERENSDRAREFRDILKAVQRV